MRPTEEAKTVKVLFSNHMLENSTLHDIKSHCIYKGEVVGSEGHWYSYLFFKNDDMTRGALNDLKNNAIKKGANVVIAHQVTDFATSVTYSAESYFCNQNSRNSL
jgi:hypothetical protein